MVKDLASILQDAFLLKKGESPKVYEVPPGKVHQVDFKVVCYELNGINMRDKEGNTLFATNQEPDGPSKTSTHTFPLHDGEVIVGFRSRTNGTIARHDDFKLMVMRDIEAEDLQVCEIWHQLFAKAKPEDTNLKGLQMNLFADIMAFDGVRVEGEFVKYLYVEYDETYLHAYQRHGDGWILK